MLDADFLARLVSEYDAPAVTGVALSGSHAHGDATRYSDVDLLRFVSGETSSPEFRMCYVDGRLISLLTWELERKRADMRQPEQAIWLVPTLRHMRILLDKRGELAALQREAEQFEWSDIEADAQRQVSGEFVWWSEELHKVLSAQVRGDESALAYATMGLLFGMVKVMARTRGVLIVSESRYFQEVGDAVGANSAWTRCLQQALGLGGATSVAARADAALRLYQETVRLLEPILQPEHRDVVQTCISILDEHTTGE